MYTTLAPRKQFRTGAMNQRACAAAAVAALRTALPDERKAFRDGGQTGTRVESLPLLAGKTMEINTVKPLILPHFDFASGPPQSVLSIRCIHLNSHAYVRSAITREQTKADRR